MRIVISAFVSFVSLVAGVCLCWAAEKPQASYSYSVKINKHEIVVTVQSKTSFDFRVDGKLYKSKEETTARQPNEPKLYSARAHLPGMTVVLMTAGPTLYVTVAGSKADDLIIEVGRPQDMHAAPRNAKRLLINGRTVTRERHTGGDIYTTAVNYDFAYQMASNGLVYQVTQTAGTKDPASEFRQAVETFKLRTPHRASEATK